jgi:hypothetical protein
MPAEDEEGELVAVGGVGQEPPAGDPDSTEEESGSVAGMTVESAISNFKKSIDPITRTLTGNYYQSTGLTTQRMYTVYFLSAVSIILGLWFLREKILSYIISTDSKSNK